jgi:hypothetical protein
VPACSRNESILAGVLGSTLERMLPAIATN